MKVVEEEEEEEEKRLGGLKATAATIAHCFNLAQSLCF